MHKSSVVKFGEHTVNFLIATMGIAMLGSGLFSAMFPNSALTDTGAPSYVTEQVLNTKLETMKGQINRGFDKQGEVIDRIGNYLEGLQKQGKLPQTSEVLKDAAH